MSEPKAVIPARMRRIPDELGYSPGLIAEGRFLFIAGQLGRDDDLNVIADAEAQFTRAWQNVLDILVEAGATVRDIVDVTTFHVDMRAHRDTYRRVRERVMQGHRPPWTAIGVTELSRPGLLVEIKCIARLPDDR
jgi:enamine deaminase RidA (YjgF/YER057c/UK114 family)